MTTDGIMHSFKNIYNQIKKNASKSCHIWAVSTKKRDFRQTRIEGRTPLNNRAIEIHVKIQESKAHFEAFLARNLIIFMNKSLKHR